MSECDLCKNNIPGRVCELVELGDVFDPYSGSEVSCPHFELKEKIT